MSYSKKGQVDERISYKDLSEADARELFNSGRNKNKYGAVKQTYGGYTYHSKKEAKFAAELDLMLRGGAIDDWERQVKIGLFGENETRVCNYYIDFLIHHNDGTKEYVEVKGFWTPLAKLKRKLFEDKIKDEKNIKYTVVK